MLSVWVTSLVCFYGRLVAAVASTSMISTSMTFFVVMAFAVVAAGSVWIVV